MYGISILNLFFFLIFACGRHELEQKSLTTPKLLKEFETSNSHGIEFITINAGSFKMGSPEFEVDRKSDEKLHSVTISKSFEMGKYELTQAQWKSVMGKKHNPSTFQDSDDLPVDSVSWNYVHAFFRKINNGTDRCGDTSTDEGFKKAFATPGCYRLPTEAEWEYAARAGTKTPFYTGENISTAQSNYNGDFPYNNHPKGKNRKMSVTVKELDALNPWGLAHMTGNVCEWTQDRYGDYDLSEKNKIDPMGATTGIDRVCRGGSWYDAAQLGRSAYRFRDQLGDSYYNVGFRVVRTL